jgi:hypothetical protein
VCSALRTELADSPLARAETLMKPYLDEELIAACVRALSAANG